MLLNHLKLSLRLLARSPFFTLINVAGLSVGLLAFFVLWQHCALELKTDQYHKDFERIGRIGAHWRWTEKNGHQGMWVWSTIMSHQAAQVFSDFPQIEEHCRFIHSWQFIPDVVGMGPLLVFSVDKEDTAVAMFRETKVISADPNLFQFFTIPLIRGDKSTVLKNPNSVVLSEKAARKYFGTQNPVNRQLRVNDSTLLVVTGVFEDLPRNTHLSFDIVMSNAGREFQWADPTHLLSSAQTFVKLSSSNGFDELANLLNSRKERYWGALKKNYPDGRADMFIVPLHEVAFSADEKSRTSIRVLQVVSVVILAMAWINYMNLTVSRIAKRSKEIATRKVSGAHHSDFIGQFLVESFLLNGISLAVAFTIIQLIRQPFELVFDIQIPDLGSIPVGTWMAVLGFVISGILITALYPAFLSARYSIRKLLVKRWNPTRKSALPVVLTSVQYAAAFVLITWAFIIYSQLTYLFDKDFMKRDKVLVVEAPMIKPPGFAAAMNALVEQMRMRSMVTVSSSIVGDDSGFRFGMKRREAEEFHYYNSDGGVDEQFLPLFGIPLLAGRNFVANEKPNSVMISQLASRRMGFLNMDDAVGAPLRLIRIGALMEEYKEFEVVGVYDDYPMELGISTGGGGDAENAHEGTVLLFKNEAFNHLLPERMEILVDRENINETLAFAEDAFKKIFPGSVFTWYVLADHINDGYSSEKTARNQIGLFTGLAIGIACLGLLGIIMNKASEKIKEIGIRKVLGASIRQISQVLLYSTAMQFMVAVILSLPIALYLGSDYLQHYRDQIQIQWWHLASPVAMLVMIMLGTVVVTLYNAARNNPVEALKHE